MNDYIIDEVRKVRLDHAKKFNFDMDAICEDLREIQKTSGHKVVSLPPKRRKPKTDPIDPLPSVSAM